MRTLIPLVSVLFLASACATGGSPASSGPASSGPAASGKPAVQTKQGHCSVHSKRECDWATRYQYYSPR